MKIKELFQDRSVILVGDIMLDVFVPCGKDRRSSEDTDAWCFTMRGEHRLPGGVGCTARCVKALGGNPEVFAVTGTGTTNRRLRDGLRDYGISDRGLHSVSGRPTTLKRRYEDAEHPGRQFFVTEAQDRSDIDDAAAEAIGAGIQLSDAKVILVSDYMRGVVSKRLCEILVEEALENGRYLIVDGRLRDLSWYEDRFGRYIDLITPNRREAECMLGGVALGSASQLQSGGRAIQEALMCNVLLTLSEQGARLFGWNSAPSVSKTNGDRGHGRRNGVPGDEYAYQAHNGNPVNVSGAGDTLAATIALCIAAGMPLPEACELGSMAASISVGKPGSEVASADELQALVDGVPLREILQPGWSATSGAVVGCHGGGDDSGDLSVGGGLL